MELSAIAGPSGGEPALAPASFSCLPDPSTTKAADHSDDDFKLEDIELVQFHGGLWRPRSGVPTSQAIHRTLSRSPSRSRQHLHRAWGLRTVTTRGELRTSLTGR